MQCKGLVAHIPDAPNGTGIFTYIYHKCKPKVGKYSIHGATGYLNYLLYTVFHGQKGLVVPSHHTHTHMCHHVPIKQGHLGNVHNKSVQVPRTICPWLSIIPNWVVTNTSPLYKAAFITRGRVLVGHEPHKRHKIIRVIVSIIPKPEGRCFLREF